jgi:hypothetical protein
MIEEFFLFVGAILSFWALLLMTREDLERVLPHRGGGPLPGGGQFVAAGPAGIVHEPVENYRCGFCGGLMFDLPQQFFSADSLTHAACGRFKQALQSQQGTHLNTVFLGADDTFLRLNIGQIDPCAEVTMTLERHAPFVIGYRVEVRRRSLIKSAHKE